MPCCKLAGNFGGRPSTLFSDHAWHGCSAYKDPQQKGIKKGIKKGILKFFFLALLAHRLFLSWPYNPHHACAKPLMCHPTTHALKHLPCRPSSAGHMVPHDNPFLAIHTICFFPGHTTPITHVLNHCYVTPSRTCQNICHTLPSLQATRPTTQ